MGIEGMVKWVEKGEWVKWFKWLSLVDVIVVIPVIFDEEMLKRQELYLSTLDMLWMLLI